MKDIGRSKYIALVCHFYLSTGFSLPAKPPHRVKECGVFAIRAPMRPNPIGISLVRLVRVETNKIQVRGVDVSTGRLSLI
ncbi:MAG: TrmO family methyltransferase [archaeon]